MSPLPPRDAYRYFRVEARDLWDGLQRGVLDLEKGAPAKEAVAALLRQAHTLKGAARIVGLNAVAGLAHQMEEELEPLREGFNPPLPGLVEHLFAVLDEINGKLGDLEIPPATQGAAPPASVAGPKEADHRSVQESHRLDSVRLGVSDLNEVMEIQRETGARLTLLRRHSVGLSQAKRLAHSLTEARTQGSPQWKAQAAELEAWLDGFERVSLSTLEAAARDLDVAHARIGRMRLSPASALFAYLERTCRDAAGSLGKSVRFVSLGGDLRLDAPVLQALQDTLQHIVRNAVVHGIEDAAARLKAGKPEFGVVRVDLTLLHGRAVVRCTDDGQGLDLAALEKIARAHGHLPSASSLSVEEACALLLRGGLSTSKGVTQLAGRGVGMDILRATLERLNGNLQMRSSPGQGLELRIEVPLALSAYEVLEVESGGLRALIPFGAVRSAHYLNPADLSKTERGETILMAGEALPLLALDACLGTPRRRPRMAVLIGDTLGSVALGVDRISGLRDAVIQPLPELTPSSDLVVGTCLDSAGNPCLVLDPECLIRAAREHRPPSGVESTAPRLPLLVVDDSLTTRMLEQGILETAGYSVDLAASAEEGLAKLRLRRYGLLLVDVEMPGMNGFALLELLKGDPLLSAIPAILVTSCASQEDKLRGAAAGARDYIVKGEFDQARLLARIRDLLV